MTDRAYGDHDPRHLMDLHEDDSYMGTGLGVWEDPDGGLLRYSNVIRRVMELADEWARKFSGGPMSNAAFELRDRARAALVNPDLLRSELQPKSRPSADEHNPQDKGDDET